MSPGVKIIIRLAGINWRKSINRVLITINPSSNMFVLIIVGTKKGKSISWAKLLVDMVDEKDGPFYILYIYYVLRTKYAACIIQEK